MQSIKEAQHFATGDVVTLKSGGRRMTAAWVGPVAFATGIWLICEWLGDDGEVHRDMFPGSTLEPACRQFDTLTASV